MISKFFLAVFLLFFGLNGAEVPCVPKYQVHIDGNSGIYVEVANDAADQAQLREICQLIVEDRIDEAKALLNEMDRQSDGKLTLIVEFLRNYPFLNSKNLERIAIFSGLGAIGAFLTTVFFCSKTLNATDFSFVDSLLWGAATCGCGIVTIISAILFYISSSGLKQSEKLKEFAQNILNFLDQWDDSIGESNTA